MADSAGPANPTKPAVLIIGGLGMSFRVLLGPVVIAAAEPMPTYYNAWICCRNGQFKN